MGCDAATYTRVMSSQHKKVEWWLWMTLVRFWKCVLPLRSSSCHRRLVAPMQIDQRFGRHYWRPCGIGIGESNSQWMSSRLKWLPNPCRERRERGKSTKEKKTEVSDWCSNVHIYLASLFLSIWSDQVPTNRKLDQTGCGSASFSIWKTPAVAWTI